MEEFGGQVPGFGRKIILRGDIQARRNDNIPTARKMGFVQPVNFSDPSLKTVPLHGPAALTAHHDPDPVDPEGGFLAPVKPHHQKFSLESATGAPGPDKVQGAAQAFMSPKSEPHQLNLGNPFIKDGVSTGSKNVLGIQLPATLLTAPRQNTASARGGHARTKTNGLLTSAFMRLKCTFRH
jgi:hypothetical protein